MDGENCSCCSIFSSFSSLSEPLFENSSLACRVTADDRICVTACRLLLFSLAGGKKKKELERRKIANSGNKSRPVLFKLPPCWLTFPKNKHNTSSGLIYKYPLDSTCRRLSVRTSLVLLILLECFMSHDDLRHPDT